MDFKEANIFGLGEKNESYAPYFDGVSYLKPLLGRPLGIVNVSFEPGTRNHWHIHQSKKGGGQILIAIAGHGYFQEWGKDPVRLNPGDVVYIEPGVKHWHGAAPNEWFSHLSIEVPSEEPSTEWLESVDEDFYANLG